MKVPVVVHYDDINNEAQGRINREATRWARDKRLIASDETLLITDLYINLDVPVKGWIAKKVDR